MEAELVVRSGAAGHERAAQRFVHPPGWQVVSRIAGLGLSSSPREGACRPPEDLSLSYDPKLYPPRERELQIDDNGRSWRQVGSGAGAAVFGLLILFTTLAAYPSAFRGFARHRLMYLFDAGTQQRVVDSARKRRCLCWVRNHAVATAWATGREVPSRPLVRFMRDEFRPAFEAGGYELLVRNRGGARTR